MAGDSTRMAEDGVIQAVEVRRYRIDAEITVSAPDETEALHRAAAALWARANQHPDSEYVTSVATRIVAA